ncbi:hypothetical protein [Hymenobacter chitinivorans]|uniref:Histidine kinase N-terminal 7TM region domain-containing protein n=1 Tax=Hymenobacter chitinivorans DSM 11115 TaxID=1121954 RepID=A0A2M9BML9_9BACT|nr:hypothetical protein [Hymenobacter chitinivorans]PJJ59150.1 hypothetical protein CLV45_0565 [Hymenobacter chitinivorans DSM 11115]
MSTPDHNLLVTIAKQLNLLSVFCYLLPLAVCIWRWPVLARRRRIGAALVLILVLNIWSEVGRRYWHNNILSTYLIIWLETLFLSYTYYQTFNTRLNRQLLVGASMVFLATAVSEYVFWAGLYGTKTYTRMAQSLLLIGAALMYFEKILRELRNIRLERDPMFLVSVGVTLYYSGTLMVFVLEDSMQKNYQINQIWLMYSIQSVLLIAFNGLLAVALYNSSKSTDSALATQPTPF